MTSAFGTGFATLAMSFELTLVSACSMPQSESHGLCGDISTISANEVPATQAKALRGDSESALQLARYYSAKGERVNEKRWYEASAREGNAKAMYILGSALAQPGDSYNESEALYWLRKASASRVQPIAAQADRYLNDLGRRSRKGSLTKED